MFQSTTPARWLAVLIFPFIPLLCFAQDQPAAAPPPVPAQEQPEALTSGPVHEAFAEPVNVDNQQPIVAPSQPPQNVQETPPAQRPSGDNYVWVPGYWAWDNDRHNYIWVSGCWRIAPPSTYWVPGYWSQTASGYQWVAGFWAPLQQQELLYQPEPPQMPADQLAAPATPPSPDQVWVPPCYYWVNSAYVLRPGYWVTAQAGWLWTPSCNRWTPRGYVFCPGHWDYSFPRRGLLFAPVAFGPNFAVGASFAFTPNIVLDLGVVNANLFVYPRYCHYYFGDYYDPGYVKLGIYAPFDYGHLHHCYDPIYVHERWSHLRSDPRWEDEQRHEYDLRRDDRNLRPARTYQEMQTRVARPPEADRARVRMAEPLATVAANTKGPMKFEESNREAQQKLTSHAADVRKYSEQRTGWEANPKAPVQGTPRPEPRAAPAPTAQPRQPEQRAAEPRPEPRPAEPQPPEPRSAEPRAAEPRAPVVVPPESHQPAATPTPERRAPVPAAAPPAAPAETHAPAAQPAERRPTPTPAAAPPETHAPASPPGPSHQAERVKVPESPVSARRGGEPPPARPTPEAQDHSTPRNDTRENR